MRRREFPLLAALFLDLVGFGMAFPDIQIRSEKLGAPGWLIGILLALLFAVQFIASPRWGKLSDRVGRKPIVVLCTVLSACSMLVYAGFNSLWAIGVSRILGGLAAANVVVAQAYLAETTPESDRAGAMGRIGAAISTGLIVGPVFGGQLVEWGGSSLMGFAAAGASAMAALILFFGLESRPPAEQREPGKSPVIDLRLLREFPALRAILLAGSVSWFALACLEGTFGRLLEAHFRFPVTLFGIEFRLPQGASGAIFGFESLIALLVQGLLFARLSKRFADQKLLTYGFLLQGAGLVAMPHVPALGWMLVASGFYSLGTSLANPMLNTIASRLAPENRQGELFGLMQASRSIGFLVGPILGGILFDFSPAAPYWMAGASAIAATLIFSLGRPDLGSSPNEPTAT